MKVSIIIPIFNAESYLNKCLEAACAQTYKDIELILVNDGSTDSSRDICLKYEASDPRIRLIDRDNSGVSAARNKGLDIATGDLISFIDSDDYVEADYIEYMLTLMNETSSSITCVRHEACEGISTRVIEGPQNILEEYLKSNEIYASVWGKLYKRELFDGIRFPEGKRYEDNYVLYKVLARCGKLSIGSEVKYHYILNPGSFMNKGYAPSQMDIVDAMEAQKQFIDKSFPALTPFANARLVYAANRCLMKMADAKVSDKDCIARLRPIYKEYSKDFLNGSSGRSAKAFVRVARVSPKLAMRVYRLIGK
ncbi:MAG: glycosyltransferase [Saccharofermentans sp.]|nr:glycosyltransferase [Saccharofermentans sp.]